MQLIQRCLQLGHGFFQIVDHLDRVLTLRFEDVECENALAVIACQVFLFMLAVDDRRNLSQQDRLTTAARNNDAFKIFRPLDPALYLYHLFIGSGTD